MILYSITDCDLRDEFGWCIAVWADDADAALAFAREKYTEGGDLDDIHIIGTKPGDALLGPAKPGIHEERRCDMLRLAGWREEDERSCDTCGLYPMGLSEFSVCESCYQCRECADGTCEECGGEE